MKVLIVMFLVTVIAHGVTPILKCWACEDAYGQLPCRDPNKFQLVECLEDDKFCIDAVHKKYEVMKKSCINEKELEEIKSVYSKDEAIIETCDTTECNTKKWEDYI